MTLYNAILVAVPIVGLSLAFVIAITLRPDVKIADPTDPSLRPPASPANAPKQETLP